MENAKINGAVRFESEAYEGSKKNEALKDFMYDNIMSASQKLEDFVELLDFSSQYCHKYSLRNSMLLAMQGASPLVAPFGKLKEMDLQLQKGSKGYSIFLPVTMQKIEKEEGKFVFKRKDNEAEWKELLAKGLKPVQHVSFKVGHVFDLGSTNIKEEDLPKALQSLNVEMPDALSLDDLKKVVEKLGYDLEFGNTSNIGLAGYAGKGTRDGNEYRVIKIADRLPDSAKASTIIHEIAHHKMHFCDNRSHEITETQAETAAYLVTKSFGLDTSSKSFQYLNSHVSKLEKETFMEVVDESFKCASEIINAIKEVQFEAEKEKDKEMER